MIDPGDQLLDWIKNFSKLFAGESTLFIIDDCIADEWLNKRRGCLLELAISGRHRNHSLWLLTQSYTAIPKNLRRQKKMLFMWYPNEKPDLRIADDETNVIPDNEMGSIKEQLKQSKHGCLFIRIEHPRCYKIINEAS